MSCCQQGICSNKMILSPSRNVFPTVNEAKKNLLGIHSTQNIEYTERCLTTFYRWSPIFNKDVVLFRTHGITQLQKSLWTPKLIFSVRFIVIGLCFPKLLTEFRSGQAGKNYGSNSRFYGSFSCEGNIQIWKDLKQAVMLNRSEWKLGTITYMVAHPSVECQCLHSQK